MAMISLCRRGGMNKNEVDPGEILPRDQHVSPLTISISSRPSQAHSLHQLSSSKYLSTHGPRNAHERCSGGAMQDVDAMVSLLLLAVCCAGG